MEASKKSSVGGKVAVALAALWLVFCAAMLALYFTGKVELSESAVGVFGFSLVSVVVYAFKQSMKS